MKCQIKNIDDIRSRVLTRIAAERKKTIAALSLLVVTVFMWVKVLGQKNPQSANASTAISTMQDPQSVNDSVSKIQFIELPVIEKKHHKLNRDFFNGEDWDIYAGSGQSSQVVGKGHGMSDSDSEKLLRLISEKLQLEVIEIDQNRRAAFINNKLLVIGDKLSITDGVKIYECEIVGIEKDVVTVGCGQLEVDLKLKRFFENDG